MLYVAEQCRGSAELPEQSAGFLLQRRVPHSHCGRQHHWKALSMYAKPAQTCERAGWARGKAALPTKPWSARDRRCRNKQRAWLALGGDFSAGRIIWTWKTRSSARRPLQVRAEVCWGRVVVCIAGASIGHAWERSWWIHSCQAGTYHLNCNLPFKFWQASFAVCLTNLSFVSSSFPRKTASAAGESYLW